MQYINISTLELVNRQHIVEQYPETSFPPDLTYEILEELDYLPIEEDERPELEPGETTELGEVRIENGRAMRGWVVIPAPESVITEVTMRQARLALLQSGLLHLVDTAIDSLEEPDKSAARIEWEYSQVVERNRQFVMMLGAALELDENQIDALFKLAVTL